jgi:PBSX family phage terminase large subunit
MINLSEIILPEFHGFWRTIKSGVVDGIEKTFFVAKGGRNSSKSTTISIACILLLVEFPINILAMRKVGNTIEKSAYEQLKKATIFLGIQDEFIFKKSPLEIIYKKRGNKIIFHGADDTVKMKSIVTAEFPITILWIEELAEFKTEEEIQTIIDSILREKLPEGLKYKILYSYNPPKRKQNWVNKKFETQFLPKNVYVHHSDYTCNKYLSEQTLQEIEILKETNIKKYNWLYLGQPTGGGVVPFENLVFRKITEEEIKTFDNIRQGLDYGYASDPAAFTKWHYDKTRRKIYAVDEIYGTKLSNRYMVEQIKRLNCQNTKTIADSSEPKSIAEMSDLGINIAGASKGEGSVEYGEKWLDDLDEIVIDYQRTPNIAREFENIDYQMDKDGNQKPRLEDKDNHCIDSTRYSFERDMGRSFFVRLG